MTQRPRFAGGFFLIAAIMIGSVWGVATAHVLVGLGIGFATGLLLAIAVWLVDSRPRGSSLCEDPRRASARVDHDRQGRARHGNRRRRGSDLDGSPGG